MSKPIDGWLPRAVRYRYPLALLIFALSQVVAWGAWLALPHYYKAEAVVLLDLRSNPAQMVADDERQNAMATKASLLQSRLLADRVVTRLDLRNNEMLRRSWDAMDVGRRPAYDDWLASLVSGGLVPEMAKGSLVLKVGYASASEDFSVALANAFAAELVNLSDALNRGYDAFVGQAYGVTSKQRHDELVEAQKAALVAAQRSAAISRIPESALREYLQVGIQANRRVGSYIQSEAAKRSIDALGDTGSLLDDSFIRAQQAALSDLRSQRAATATSMGESHPVVKALDASIRAKELSIRQYEAKVRTAVGVSVKTAAGTAGQLTEATQALKQVLLDSEASRKAYEAAQQEVDETGARYEEALMKDALITLDRDAPRSDVRLLSAAMATGVAWLPVWYIFFPVSGFVGVLLALCGAYIFERHERRVRTAEDVLAITGVPVINVLRRD